MRQGTDQVRRPVGRMNGMNEASGGYIRIHRITMRRPRSHDYVVREMVVVKRMRIECHAVPRDVLLFSVHSEFSSAPMLVRLL